MFSVSSLTDIVMLLLIFFLLSSSFVLHPGVKVQLPGAETKDRTSDKSVVVTLTDKGLLYVNADAVTIETLGKSVAAAMGNDKEKTVIIQADRDVSLQQAVQVIDIAKSVGASRFFIATQPLHRQ